MISTSIPFDSAIKLSFFDKDGKKVEGISIKKAIKVWEKDNSTLFYFKTGDGTEQELTIEEVKQLPTKKNILPSKSDCNAGPVPCGPPLVKFFGGGGFGAAANAIISPTSSSLIGFDIVNPGKGYKSPPNAELIDSCGKGSGSSVRVTIKDGSIDKVVVVAPGDGYISAPDGSLGGNERVWKEPDEGYVQTTDGRYYVVQPYRPIKCEKGSTYYPPDGPPRLCEGEVINLPLVPVKKTRTDGVGQTYSVYLCIEEIEVLDSGFGYRPGDQLIITPDNGTKTELVINEFGQITSVKILRGGCGYNDIPEIRTNSATGFNATFVPIFKATPQPKDPFVVPEGANIVEVIDCVGKIPPKQVFDIVPR
jgi:hypothetical protein